MPSGDLSAQLTSATRVHVSASLQSPQRRGFGPSALGTFLAS